MTEQRETPTPAPMPIPWQWECADCGNRVLLVDLREANADSRWFDE